MNINSNQTHGSAAADKVCSGYMELFNELISAIEPSDISRAADMVRQARDAGGFVYICGNGGSASTATHLANDLAKATKGFGLPSIRALSMSDNNSWLTALGNDEGYDRVFSGQLENFLKKDDLLIVISTSGNSSNLVSAVELAKKYGVPSLGILGFAGGKLKDMVDESIWLESPAGAYGPVESAHSVVVDLIKECLMADKPAADGVA